MRTNRSPCSRPPVGDALSSATHRFFDNTFEKSMLSSIFSGWVSIQSFLLTGNVLTYGPLLPEDLPPRLRCATRRTLIAVEEFGKGITRSSGGMFGLRILLGSH